MPRAKVERFKPVKLAGYLNTRERARLKCGCCMYVGINRMTGKAATASHACSEGHQALVEIADETLRGWLPLAGRRKLVDACAAALGKAQAAF